jgi:hypothetical protein
MYYLQNMTKPSVALKFTVIADCSTTRARAALMELPHATVETPVFMPVGTQGKNYPFCYYLGCIFYAPISPFLKTILSLYNLMKIIGYFRHSYSINCGGKKKVNPI